MTGTSLNRARPAAVVAAVAIAVLALTAVFPYSWPRGLVLQGAGYGMSAGLLAIGLVLTYRTSRVINFAYGAMGSAAAEIGVVARQVHHLPWGVCVALSIAGGALIGLGVDAIMRRFTNAPRLVVTVATVGLLQVLIGLQFGFAFWSHANTLVPPFPTGLTKSHVSVDNTIFTGNDAIAFALAPIALVGISWFLMRTQSGAAVRAMADNLDRAKLLGIPIRRLSRLVWVLVAVLSAATMILNAPSNGIPSSPFVSAGGIFMPALAAAVVARMESLPVAFLTGTGLGVFDAVVAFNVHKSSLQTVAMLIVILAALLLRRWPPSRAGSNESSWSLTAVSRPLTANVARLPEVRIARAVVPALLISAAIFFPTIAGPAELHTFAGYIILGIAVLSLVVLSGWSGIISLGQLAIVGVGAVTAGDLMVKLNLDLSLALALAAIAGAVISLLIGLPALKTQPIFLAVTTLAFAAAMDQYFLNPTNYPQLIPATIVRPVLWKRFPLTSEKSTYYLCVAFLIITILLVQAWQRTRPARVLQATRDNPRAASAFGISPHRAKLAAMVAAGMIAGVAGGLWAVLEEGVGGSSFPAQDSVVLFSMGVVGGLVSIRGALSGVAVTELLTYLIGRTSAEGAQFATLGTGILLLAVLIVFPGGLAQGIDRVRDRYAAWAAKRHGIELTVGAADGSTTSLAPDEVTGPISAPVTLAVARHANAESFVLSCRDLTAAYGPLQVLFGVNIDIADGEIVALLGTNGAGKSTIFKAITGLLAGHGTVTLDGHDINGQATDTIARRGLAMMPGGRGVFPTLTVEENLRLATWQLREDKDAAQAAQLQMYEMFPSVEAHRNHPAGNLSGGEQQQLSLAMAFVTNPKVLLIDELSLGLAPVIVGQLCEKVRDIRAAGTTVVVVEQSLNVALELADRAIFLEKGAVRFEGPTRELLERPGLLRSVFIGEALNDGAAAAEADVPRSRYTDLICRGLTKSFGGIAAVNGVDLIVEPGTIVGLIGHNGAGKTTLFDIISGHHVPDSGQVLLGGHDITRLRPHHRAVYGLGRSFQEATLFPSLTVFQTIVVALDQHFASRDWVSAALGAPSSVDTEFAAYVRASELCELLGLSGFADTPIADLSTGTRRIVELACVLAQDPAVILLDEPSAGVAQKDTEALGPLLRRVQRETGSAIVIIEHDMALIGSLCDKLVALEEGTVICTGPPTEVLAHPRVIESYLGNDEKAIQRSGPTAVGLI